MAPLAPFTLPLLPDEVAKLEARLSDLRWPDPLPGTPWQGGADVRYLKEFCEYWRDSYDWPIHVERINRIPQYSTQIDGVTIVFWHVMGKVTDKPSMPLLLLHGWPGSQIEFEGLINPLSDPAGDGASGQPAFDLVVPALPGFGFSGKPRETGWNADRIADAFHTLMTGILGYSRYGVQGCDWGALIGTRMAYRHGRNLIGLHLNMPVAAPPPDTQPDVRRQERMQKETGYFHLQTTKPDTVTMGLSESPIGLAAWILEKFRAWSDCAGNIESVISRDTLITNLMYYWLTNSAGSAARIYYESANMIPPLMQTGRIEVPTGVAAFPKEPFAAPRSWLENAFSIVHWTDMPRGGHFAALEQPELLIADIRSFFARVMPRQSFSHSMDLQE